MKAARRLAGRRQTEQAKSKLKDATRREGSWLVGEEVVLSRLQADGPGRARPNHGARQGRCEDGGRRIRSLWKEVGGSMRE
jgi:hypothetical protein